MKKTAALSILMLILSGALVRAEDAAPRPAAKRQKYTQAELDASPYLKSVVTREGTMADTSKFKKKGPYKIALAAQGPTNSWAALFDQEARYHVDQLGKDKVSELLYASADGSADKQVPEVEDLLSQNPDALILVPMGRAALAASVDRAAAQGVPVVLVRERRRWRQLRDRSRHQPVRPGRPCGELARRPAWRLRRPSSSWTASPASTRLKSPRPARPASGRTSRASRFWTSSTASGRPAKPRRSPSSGSPSTARTFRACGRTADRCLRASSKLSRKPSCRFRRSPALTTATACLRQVKDGNINFLAGQYPNAMVILCIDTALKILNGESVPRFIDFRDSMDKTQDVTKANIDNFYNPKWSDDVFPPIFLPDSKMVELKYMSK